MFLPMKDTIVPIHYEFSFNNDTKTIISLHGLKHMVNKEIDQYKEQLYTRITEKRKIRSLTKKGNRGNLY